MVRATDIVARLGGDEFVIVTLGLRRREDAVPLAHRVLRLLAAPTEVNGERVRIGASLGIALIPRMGWMSNLAEACDIALTAQTAGRGMYRYFDEQLTQAVAERRLLESELRLALDAEALEVHFQPKFAASSLDIVGFEALARWRHRRAYICPSCLHRRGLRPDTVSAGGFLSRRAKASRRGSRGFR